MFKFLKRIFRKRNYNLSKEDLDFLIELQHEMLTQDHIGQAAPRFWVVQGRQRVYTGEDYASEQCLLSEEGTVLADSLEETIEYFDKEYDLQEEGIEITQEEYGRRYAYHIRKIDPNYNPDDEDADEDYKYMEEHLNLTDIEEIIDALVECEVIGDGSYSVGYYNYEQHIYPDTMFLTNRSCKEHIRRNYYHYSDDAHSYAMTAWRSPEVEMLWNILDKIDWKKIKEDSYGGSERYR